MTNSKAFSGKLPITVIIAAKNECVNMGKCLESLRPAKKVILLDSGSSDGTIDIASQYEVEIIQFYYKGGYPKKRQWALDNLSFETKWIFFIDADERVPHSLWREIEVYLADAESKNISAFVITKGFHFMGKRFRFGGFSHRAVLLFKYGSARFEHLIDDPAEFQDMEVHERLIVTGNIRNLRTPIIHEDFKGLSAYVDRHNKYSSWEAMVRFSYLNNGNYGRSTIVPNLWGNCQERRRFFKKLAVRLPFEPYLWFFFHYIIKLGFLEGKRGLIASQIRSAYIAQVRAKIFELKLRRMVSNAGKATSGILPGSKQVVSES